MQPTKYRAQILLEPEQHQALVETARQENRSISELVREIIREWVEKKNREVRLQRELKALQELAEIRRQIEEEHGIYTGNLLEEARDERDDDMDRVWRGEA